MISFFTVKAYAFLAYLTLKRALKIRIGRNNQNRIETEDQESQDNQF